MGLNLISGTQSRGRYGSGGARQPIAEINMTPFIDVMLVLLIIFMISAPMLSVGVKVDLPKASASALNDKVDPLEVRVMKDKIMIQDQVVTMSSLATQLNAVAQNKKDTPVHLRADRSLSYEQVMQVISAVRNAGFTKLALVSEQPTGAAPATP
jgi:biopolymer transport protein TolR